MTTHQNIRKHVLWMWVGMITSLLALYPVYLSSFIVFASKTEWYGYLVLGAVISGLLMCMWKQNIGEEAQIAFFHLPFMNSFGPGPYFLPNFLPFLREINLVLGFSLEIVKRDLSLQPVHNPNVHIYSNQKVSNYQARVQTTSFLKINTDRAISNLLLAFFNVYDKHGEIVYSKVGNRMFLILMVIASLGIFVAPAKSEKITPNNFISRLFSDSQTAGSGSKKDSVKHDGGTIRTTSYLRKGPRPTMPPQSMFIEQPEVPNDTNAYKMIDGRKYMYYHDPKLGHEVPVLKVYGSLCALIPIGKIKGFLTRQPPNYEINTEYLVGHMEDYSYSNEVKRFPLVPWPTLYESWVTLPKDQLIIVRALTSDKMIDEKSGGGLVCF